MANEKRLIDANEARKHSTHDIITHFLDRCPTVDAVEVVRCKDCINYSENKYDPDNGMWCKCWCDWLPTDPDDFCSYGERREGE